MPKRRAIPESFLFSGKLTTLIDEDRTPDARGLAAYEYVTSRDHPGLSTMGKLDGILPIYGHLQCDLMMFRRNVKEEREKRYLKKYDNNPEDPEYTRLIALGLFAEFRSLLDRMEDLESEMPLAATNRQSKENRYLRSAYFQLYRKDLRYLLCLGFFGK